MRQGALALIGVAALVMACTPSGAQSESGASSEDASARPMPTSGGAARTVQAELLVEQLENGQNKAIADYHETVRRCQAAGWQVKPLTEDQVSRLGTRRIELAVDADHRLVRGTRWDWKVPPHQLEALCLFEFVEEVREDYADRKIIGYTGDEDSPQWHEEPADPGDLDLAIDEVDFSSEEAIGWRRETDSQVSGQHCTWWRGPADQRVCMWTQGLALGFSPAPSGFCMTESADAMLAALPLQQEPVKGSGCRITTQRIQTAGALSPASFQIKTRGGIR